MEKPNELVATYQCPGCVDGGNCYEKSYNLECANHCAGTTILPVGKVFLGLPTGFNKVGACIDDMKRDINLISIFDSWEEKELVWEYDKFNVPVWKNLDENGNTLVRGISPRSNRPFIHIIKGNAMDKIDCLEITTEMQAEMD